MIPPHDEGHMPTVTLALAQHLLATYKKERLSVAFAVENVRQGTSAPRRPLRSDFSSATTSPLRLPTIRDEYQTSGTTLSTSTPGPRERQGSIVVTTVGTTNLYKPYIKFAVGKEEHREEGSSLAEDILATPSALPNHKPPDSLGYICFFPL